MISEFDRTVAAEELLEEVMFIANTSRMRREVPEVRQLLGYMEQVGLVVYVPSARRANPEKNDGFDNIFNLLPNCNRPIEKCLTFYPMHTDDTGIDEWCNFVTQMVDCASFGPSNNMITVNISTKEGLRELACAFLHELGHAYLAYLQGRIFKPASRRIDEERHLEEVEIWTREYKMILALSNRRYISAVKNLAYDIWQWWSGKKSPVDWRGKGTVLNECFGRPNSAKNAARRDTLISICCHLMAADTYLPESKRLRQKIEVIKQITGLDYREQDALLRQFDPFAYWS